MQTASASAAAGAAPGANAKLNDAVSLPPASVAQSSLAASPLNPQPRASLTPPSAATSSAAGATGEAKPHVFNYSEASIANYNTPLQAATPASAMPLANNALASYSASNLSALLCAPLASLPASSLLFHARLCAQAERWDEMCFFMRLLVLNKTGEPISNEERALFAVAYKKQLASRRMGWRYLYSIEMKERATKKKLEAEIEREELKIKDELNKEQLKKAEEMKSAAASSNSASNSSSTAASSTPVDKSTPPSTVAPSAQTDADSAPATSLTSPSSSSVLLTSLRERLIPCHSRLQSLHSYRYQLCYESSLLIHEAQGLCFDHLLPSFLSQHTHELFTKWLPFTFETVVTWEKKKSAGRNINSIKTSNADIANATSTAAQITPLLSLLPLSGFTFPEGQAAALNISSFLTLPSASASPAASAAAYAGLPPPSRLSSARPWNIESELEAQLRSLDDRFHLLASLKGAHAESMVFLLKMLADHKRLLAEFMSDKEEEENERETQALYSLCYYIFARFIASVTLSPSHPVRLGLLYNFSVFYYEVLAKPDRACQLASQAYDLALAEWQRFQQSDQLPSTVASVLGGAAGSSAAAASAAPSSSLPSSLPSDGAAFDITLGGNGVTSLESTYKDSMLLMQLIKNNLTMWLAQQ